MKPLGRPLRRAGLGRNAHQGRGRTTGTALYAKTLATLLALTLLAACGKKGSPIPPGPSNEIVYPRQYPSR